MTIVLGVAVGLFVAVIICDPAVRFIIRRVRIEPTPPKSLGESPDEWPLTTFVSDKGARWFGGLERGLYFAGVLPQARQN